MRFIRRARVGAFVVCCFAVFVLMVSYISPALAVGADDVNFDSSEPVEVVEPTIDTSYEPDSVSSQPAISVMSVFTSTSVRKSALNYLAHISGSWINFPGGAIDVDLIFNDSSASYAHLVPHDSNYLLVYGDTYNSNYPPFSVVPVNSTAYDLRFRVDAGVLKFSYRLSSSGSYTWSDYADFVISPTRVVMPSGFTFPFDTATTVFACALFIVIVMLLRR